MGTLGVIEPCHDDAQLFSRHPNTDHSSPTYDRGWPTLAHLYAAKNGLRVPSCVSTCMMTTAANSLNLSLSAKGRSSGLSVPALSSWRSYWATTYLQNIIRRVTMIQDTLKNDRREQQRHAVRCNLPQSFDISAEDSKPDHVNKR